MSTKRQAVESVDDLLRWERRCVALRRAQWRRSGYSALCFALAFAAAFLAVVGATKFNWPN